MKKRILLLMLMFLMMNTSFAENLDQNINHDSTNIMRYSAEPGSKTILSTLSESDKLKAEAEFKKGKKDYYNLGRKEPGGLKQLYAAPTMAYISTPYSLYRHGIYVEKQTFIPFSNELKAELEARADKVYIYTYSNPMWGVPSYIGNIVIKKDGKIYNGKMMDFKGVDANEGASKAYEFDINLFDGRDMDVIAVNAADYKQLIFHITAETYKKHQWY